MSNITIKNVGLLFYYLALRLGYTITVDLYKNMRIAFVYAFNPEEKKKIKRNLEAEKLTQALNERMKRVERLLYGIYEDPEYSKSDRGKNDIKELQKEIK